MNESITNDLKESLETNTDFSELKESFDDIQKTVVDATLPSTPSEESDTEETESSTTTSDQEHDDEVELASSSEDVEEQETTPPSPPPAPEKPSHGDK